MRARTTGRWSAALACLAAVACQASAPNRDAHGPADVDAYIRGMEAPERLEELQIDLVVERLGLEADDWIADLGCGPGTFALAFARACPAGMVFAVDVEPRQLDRLSEHLAGEGLANVLPVLASRRSPHLPAGRIDLIFIAHTYHHLEDRVEYMRELRKALAPGGRLAILERQAGGHGGEPLPERTLAQGELDAELGRAGWRLDVRFDTHPGRRFEIWSPVH